MVRPQFSFFITQPDGTIFGSAVDPSSEERLAYVISPDGNVAERREDTWFDLPHEQAVFVRFLAGQVYKFSANYLTKQKIF